MNETTKNFFEVWNNLEPWTPPLVLFRLYYRDDGYPIEYTHEDRDGNYIDVSPEMFRDQPMNVRVVDGKLTFITPPKITKKLTIDDQQGITCHNNDVCIVVDPATPHKKWIMQSYE